MFLDIAAYLSLLLVLCFFLVQSADLIEDVLVQIAKRVKVSPFIIGFVILSFVSSLPEASLLVSSAAEQIPSLSVGNLLGASIILLTLVVAINTLKHKEVSFSGKFTVKEVIWAMVVVGVQVIIVADGVLGFWEGVAAIATYAIFTLYISALGQDHHLHIRGLRHHGQGQHKSKDTHIEEATVKVSSLWKLSIRGLFGLIGLIVFSALLVDVAVTTASMLQVPESVIGLLVLALGTNIPEIIIALRAKNGQTEQMAVGNFIGSAAINTAILGVLAILSSGALRNHTSLIPSMIILITTLILFSIVAWSDRKIKRPEGIILLGVYLLLIVTESLIYTLN